MMRLFFAAALLVSPLSASAMEAKEPGSAPVPRDVQVTGERTCPDDLLREARGRGGNGLNKLGELPPGETFLAVHREVDGCLAPLLAREYREEEARPDMRDEAPVPSGDTGGSL